jgi:hypothetical protein
MKAYRHPSKQLPTDGLHVLIVDIYDNKFIAYYDGEDWFDAHTEEHIQHVEWWMYIPITPHE